MAFEEVLFKNHSPFETKKFLEGYPILVSEIYQNIDYCALLDGPYSNRFHEKIKDFNELLSKLYSEFKDVFDNNFGKDILGKILILEEKYPVDAKFNLPRGFRKYYSKKKRN